MTTPTQTSQTPRIFKYYPSMYAWIVFRDGRKVTFYSHELRNSLSQIFIRHVLPHVDLQYGLQSLEYLIENTYKGKYKIARIYAIDYLNDKQGILLKLYNFTGECTLIDKKRLSDDYLRELTQKIVFRLLEKCLSADIVIPCTAKSEKDYIRKKSL